MQLEAGLSEKNDELSGAEQVKAGQAKEIEQLKSQVRVLGGKLEETAQTLKSNNETIGYLNKQLTEAQKFSFRALITNPKQQQVQRKASVSGERSESRSATPPLRNRMQQYQPAFSKASDPVRCSTGFQETSLSHQTRPTYEENTTVVHHQLDLKLTNKYANKFGMGL